MCFDFHLKDKRTVCKALMFLLNILYGILAFCFIIKCTSLSQKEVNPTKVIAIGCIIIFVAIMGCGATYFESQQWTMRYFGCIFCLIVAQIIFAFMLFNEQGEYFVLIQKRISEMYDNPELNRETIDEIQGRIQCCGIKGPNFFTVMPSSCCNTTFANQCTLLVAYQEGCLIKLQVPATIVKFIAYLILGFAGLETVGFACAAWLLKIIRNEKHRVGRAESGRALI